MSTLPVGAEKKKSVGFSCVAAAHCCMLLLWWCYPNHIMRLDSDASGLVDACWIYVNKKKSIEHIEHNITIIHFISSLLHMFYDVLWYCLPTMFRHFFFLFFCAIAVAILTCIHRYEVHYHHCAEMQGSRVDFHVRCLFISHKWVRFSWKMLLVLLLLRLLKTERWKTYLSDTYLMQPSSKCIWGVREIERVESW